ncbi:MAG: CPBP family intramembrane glutamic endopeptidase [Candidatus Microsaccharimonas sp.]
MLPSSFKKPVWQKILYVVGLPLWVFLGFILSQAFIRIFVEALARAGVPLQGINTSIFNTVGGVIVYGLAIAIVIGLPRLIAKRSTSRQDLGLQRLPTWMDIVWSLGGVVAYIILTSIVAALATVFLTFIDYSQVQETGFSNIVTRPEYILAFISLVVVAPFAEELLFRGYLFGKLQKHAPIWIATLITSLLFAAVHLQWNVAIDVFALSIVLCLLRVATGSLWPAILLHMMKNSIAFYFLFINPSLLSTLG